MDNLRRRTVLLGALLVLATVVLYAPVRHHQFLDLDDRAYVPGNTHVSSGLKAENVVWAFTSYYEGNYDPITWLSHMADCTLFGLNPGAHHLVNLAIHVANVLLLFLLLRAATGAVWRSFLVAALFALHPLNVETVAWVAERKSLLSAFFSLLTVAAYGWYVRRPGWKRYLVVAAGFVLALLSKQMAVTLPVVLLLLDYWPLERYKDGTSLRGWKALVLEKLPLLAISAGMSAITVGAQRSAGAMGATSALPLSVRLETAIVAYAAYIGKLFWPARLAVYYPHPEHSLPMVEVLASAAMLGAVTWAALHFRRTRYVAMGWFLYGITLLPVSGLVKFGHIAMADRFTYIPFIGLFVIVVWGVNDLVGSNRLARMTAAGAAACAIVALAVASGVYLQYWENGVTLLTHARSEVHPDFAVEEFLAEAITSSGQDDAAVPHYQAACELNPKFTDCHYNLAIYYHRHQRFQEALEQYKLTLTNTESKETAVACLINSAKIELALGNVEIANNLLGGVLQLDPGNSGAQGLRQQMMGQAN